MTGRQGQGHPGPLGGVRVLELAGIGPAQHGAMLLADLGATVIRVDRVADVPPTTPPGSNPEVLSRGRRSVALDLKSDAGREALLALTDRADVLIDPYRPGVTERLGIGPDVCNARNPRLVYARMTGWGQSGPLASAAGHDINYIALAGALEPMGPADGMPPVPLNLVGDFGGGGMLLAFGIAAALVERGVSGRGDVVDVAMIDGAASLMTGMAQALATGDWSGARGSHWLQGTAPWYRVYRTADDRFLSLGPLEGKFYVQMLGLLALDPADWPQWDEERWPALHARLEALFATEPLDVWCRLLEGTDACFAPALSLQDAARHPHLAHRGTYVHEHGALQPAPVPRFQRAPGAIAGPPPWPGEHTTEVLHEAGFDETRIADLLADGAATVLGGATTLLTASGKSPS
jgi:alpha-methylacyl-CoA racemase